MNNVMKRIFIVLFIFLSIDQINGQIINEDFKGIWQNVNDKRGYIIINGNDVLDFYFNPESGFVNTSVSTLFFLRKYDINESIVFDSLLTLSPQKSCGKLTFLNRKNSMRYKGKIVNNKNEIDQIWNMSDFGLVPQDYLELTNQNIQTYFYNKELNSKALEGLLSQGQKDDRDYIKWFLDLDLRRIKNEKCYILDSSKQKTNSYLISGDLVKVIKKENSYIYFEYKTISNKLITGYLHEDEVISQNDIRVTMGNDVKLYKSTFEETNIKLPQGLILNVIDYQGMFYKVTFINENNKIKTGFVLRTDVY
jgi:hypothetical protein